MKFIVRVSTLTPVPYEVEADSPGDASRIVAEFVETRGVSLGDGPADGPNPHPMDAAMYEYVVEVFDDDPMAQVAMRAEYEAPGPVL